VVNRVAFYVPLLENPHTSSAMPSPHKPDVLDEVTGLGAPLLDDRPSAVDLLNFRQFVEALRNIVRNPATKTPFIIGVFGRWGTGKTTLMRMVEEDLKAREVHTVWFNAWVYGQENEIWAAFLQSLTTRLWKKFGPIEKARFSVRLFRHGLAWERLLYEVPKYLVHIALVALPVLAGALLSERLGGLLGRLASGAGIAASCAAGLALLKSVAKTVFKNSAPTSRFIGPWTSSST
jgi:hypothetical protein